MIDRINVWSRGAERAPHKQLLVLYALGQLSLGLAGKLTELLREFGPSRKAYHPEYPFWRLQNDGVWIVDAAAAFHRRTGQTDVPKRELIEKDARGRFSDEVAERLHHDQRLAAEIAILLLEGHFPASLHQDILAAVGLDTSLTGTVTRRRRDPQFRGRILAAYEYSCAVCGFDLRLGTQAVGLVAAHMQWHQAGGPDEEQNGLALCSLQHKAFDLGVFTVDASYSLLVSEHAHGQREFDEWLLRFHEQPIRPPLRDAYLPAEPFLAWHGRQVFTAPPRAKLEKLS